MILPTILCLLLACTTNRVFGVESTNSIDEASDVDATVEEEISDFEYKSPEPSGPALLAANFDDKEQFKKKWVLSQAKKEGIDEDIAKYDGVWDIEEPKKNVESGNLGLILKSKARHAAISTLLDKPFRFEDKPLIVQYEVTFQEGQECGGAYLKLLSLDSRHKDLKNFHDKTPYTIMFGPDKCGNDHKLHFIFRHRNPLNGSLEEKHAKKPKDRLEDYFKDKEPHLYTLIVRPDNSFTIKVDGNIINEGSLLEDFTPPVNPPKEIEDPDDKKPEDWDEREKIPDPTAVKPDDWNEDAPAQIVDENDEMPEGWLVDELVTIPNPEAVKPSDWDEDMDGEWEPPEIPNPKCESAPGCGPYKKRLINNPEYKGKWLPPLINNPNYKGKWKPKLIPNPEYFNDQHPFKMTSIYAVGFELWSMSPDILFDNVLVTDDESVAKKWVQDTFEIKKQKIAQESSGYYQQIVNFTAENPWIWSVYIILMSIPIVLIIYCCCFTSQDKDVKEYQDTDPLLEKNKEKDDAEVEPDSPKDADYENIGNKVQENQDEEVDDIEETDEIIENKNDLNTKPGGPRRRKPNKE